MRERANDRRQVAWDVETTGFGWDDEITVAGFWFPTNHATLLLNAAVEHVDPEQFETCLETRVDGPSVRVRTCPDEAALLAAMHDVVFERFETNYNRLVAFNADSWQGGFDLPFLRTRCVRHDHPWVFDGVQFADLWDPVKKRFNTSFTAHDASTETNSLVGSHALLFSHASAPTVFEDVPNDYSPYRTAPYDPFVDSARAVHYYEHGEYLPVLEHNLADVHRTWELGELVRAYVPGKDVTTKKL